MNAYRVEAEPYGLVIVAKTPSDAAKAWLEHMLNEGVDDALEADIETIALIEAGIIMPKENA